MRIVTTSAAVLALGLFAVWGTSASRHNAEHDATKVYNLKRLVVPAEPLLARFEGNRPSVVVLPMGGRTPHNEYRWAVLSTREWVFVNGRVLEQTCPALKDFAKANSPKTEMSPEKLDILSLALKDKSATVMAHIPRFNAKPAELEKCLGYSYDAGAGLLRIGDRAVALLAGDQPDWAAQSKQAISQ